MKSTSDYSSGQVDKVLQIFHMLQIFFCCRFVVDFTAVNVAWVKSVVNTHVTHADFAANLPLVCREIHSRKFLLRVDLAESSIKFNRGVNLSITGFLCLYFTPGFG